MPVQLTETAIAKVLREAKQSGRRDELVDAKHRGLRLQVTPGGAAEWVLACR